MKAKDLIQKIESLFTQFGSQNPDLQIGPGDENLEIIDVVRLSSREPTVTPDVIKIVVGNSASADLGGMVHNDLVRDAQ